MPFTFSHPAIVLPLAKASKRLFSLTGLVVGSIAPDFEYFIRMKVLSIHSHTLPGLFWFNMPIGAAIAFIFHGIIRNRLIDNLPPLLAYRFSSFKSLDWVYYYQQNRFKVILSLLVGAASHLAWDSFTHKTGAMVEAIDLLQHTFFLGETEIPIFKLLQHGSSLLGATVIAFAIWTLPVLPFKKKGNPLYWKDSKLLEVINNFTDKIDFNLAYSIQELKLTHGNYYDFKFLSVAAELVLLEESAKGNSRIAENTATMLSRLDYFLTNSDCLFMKDNETTYSSEEDYLKRVFGISADTKKNQLVILDSSEVNREILELLTSVISRLIFDYRKKKVGDARRKAPVHIVLDEAHRYIKRDTEYLLKENVFERIAREGRKFSLYLMVSSQRPSELSQTVLSQCGNYIIHRIQNEVDMNYIYSVLPYFSADYITRIKQATPGEALIFGNCVPMPLSVKVSKACPAPNSENCNISEEWYS